MPDRSGPALELDWELGVFRAVRALWRSLTPHRGDPWREDRVAHLTDVEGRLRWLAGLLGGRPLRILPARHGGGIRGDDLLLPKWIDLAPDADANRGLYVLRVAVDATTASRGPRAPADPVDAFAVSLRAVETSLDTLRGELPAFEVAWAEAASALHQTRPDPGGQARTACAEAAIRTVLRGERAPSALAHALRNASGAWPDSVVLWGRLIPVVGSHGAPAGPGEPAPGPGQVETELQAPPIEEITVVSLDAKEPMEMPIHAFEKVEMAESFNGSLRQLDGEDDLAAHLEALQEVDLGHLVRGGPEAHSVLRADIAMDAEVPDVGRVAADEIGLPYDEWNGQTRSWRRDWCSVFPTPLPPMGDDAEVSRDLARLRRTIEELTDRLLTHRSQRATLSRQLDGDDIDIDAIVDAVATRAAGRTPSGRLFERRPRQRRDVATTVLLDISLSADSWIAGRRVLDIARDAVLVLGEVADRLGDRLQILAFASSTRHRVRVFTVRDWDEPWTVGRRRLGALRPQGYTRLGAAIRHATDRISEVNARERLLLLVTDGKPTDWDRYEGRYGVMDVSMALRQAHAAGVATHALAVDSRARDHLPAMLGPGRWNILPEPSALVEALTGVYGKLAT